MMAPSEKIRLQAEHFQQEGKYQAAIALANNILAPIVRLETLDVFNFKKVALRYPEKSVFSNQMNLDCNTIEFPEMIDEAPIGLYLLSLANYTDFNEEVQNRITMWSTLYVFAQQFAPAYFDFDRIDRLSISESEKRQIYFNKSTLEENVNNAVRMEKPDEEAAARRKLGLWALATVPVLLGINPERYLETSQTAIKMHSPEKYPYDKKFQPTATDVEKITHDILQSRKPRRGRSYKVLLQAILGDKTQINEFHFISYEKAMEITEITEAGLRAIYNRLNRDLDPLGFELKTAWNKGWFLIKKFR